jgi:hypothetical protein
MTEDTEATEIAFRELIVHIKAGYNSNHAAPWKQSKAFCGNPLHNSRTKSKASSDSPRSTSQLWPAAMSYQPK